MKQEKNNKIDVKKDLTRNQRTPIHNLEITFNRVYKNAEEKNFRESILLARESLFNNLSDPVVHILSQKTREEKRDIFLNFLDNRFKIVESYDVFTKILKKDLKGDINSRNILEVGLSVLAKKYSRTVLYRDTLARECGATLADKFYNRSKVIGRAQNRLEKIEALKDKYFSNIRYGKKPKDFTLEERAYYEQFKVEEKRIFAESKVHPLKTYKQENLDLGIAFLETLSQIPETITITTPNIGFRKVGKDKEEVQEYLKRAVVRFNFLFRESLGTFFDVTSSSNPKKKGTLVQKEEVNAFH